MKKLKLASLIWDNDLQNNSFKLISDTNPISKDLEQVIQTKLNFNMILVKLRDMFFSTLSIKIDDKKLRKNNEQMIFRANRNLLCLKLWSDRNDLRIPTCCRVWSDSNIYEISREKNYIEGKGILRMWETGMRKNENKMETQRRHNQCHTKILRKQFKWYF